MFIDKSKYLRGKAIQEKLIRCFKSDDVIPVDLDQWFQVDVISCAAPVNYPYVIKPMSYKQLTEIFDSRIKNILEAAIDNHVTTLVLGAFGCGAFRNPPDLVGSCFHKLLYEDNYRRSMNGQITLNFMATSPKESSTALLIYSTHVVA